MHYIDVQNQLIAMKSHMMDKIQKHSQYGFGINWNSPVYPYQLITLVCVLRDIYTEAGKVFNLGCSTCSNKFDFLKYNLKMKNVYYSMFNGCWYQNKLITYNNEGKFLSMACIAYFGLDIENYNGFLYFNNINDCENIDMDLDEIYDICKSGNAIGILYMMNKFYNDMIQ